MNELDRNMRKLQESERRLSRAQAIAHVGDWEWDLETDAVHWSDELYRIYGFQSQEVAPDYQLVLQQMHPDSKEKFLQAIDSALKGEKPFEMDYTFFRRDGSEATLHTVGKVIYDENGAPVRMAGVVQDITGQKEVESQLRFSEEKFRTIFDKANDGIAMVDAESRKFVEVNRILCQMLGYSKEELSLLGVADIHPEGDLSTVQAAFEKQLRGELAVAEYLPIKRKDGTIFYADINATPIDMGGRPCMLGIFRDITERKHAEEELKAQEKRLAESQRIAKIGSFEHNLEINRAIWSAEMFRLIGLDPERDEEDFDLFFSLVHPEDQPRLKKAIAETVRTGKSFNIDYRLTTKDGNTRIFRAAAELLPNRAGKPVLLSGTAQDITECKLTENLVNEKNNMLQTLIDAIPDQVFFKDAEGRYQLVNKAMLETSGLGPENLIGVTDEELSPPNVAAKCRRSDAEAVRKGYPIYSDENYIDGNGELRYLDVVKAPIRDNNGELKGLVVLSRDITERKRKEEQNERLRKLNELILSAAGEGIYGLDTEGRITFANPAAIKMVGWEAEELLGQNQHQLLHHTKSDGSPYPADDCPIYAALRDGELHRAAGDVFWHRNGSSFPVEYTSTPLVNNQGIIDGAVVIFRDITERKMAEEKLQKSEEYIRNILDTVDDGFIVIDRDHRILTANRAYCAQVGLPLDQILGRHCYEVSHKRSRPCEEDGEECCIDAVFTTGLPHQTHHRHEDAEGNTIYVETKGFPLRDNSGRVTRAIETVSDITEKRLLEEERLKVQKLEAIGTLAGGIAHDFNNLLQGVFGYLSIAKLASEQNPKCFKALENAEKAIDLSVKLTNQLLTFSKGGKPTKKPTDLCLVIDNAVRFSLSGSSSYCHVTENKELWQVEADEGQLTQVIQNIILNAAQAMPGGGMVEISTRNLPVSDPAIPEGLPEGCYVEIMIRDQGIGIREEDLPRIFDPYFSTREKGSGLGLATSYSIIKNHGGRIKVVSRPGEGTVFSIYLPATAQVEQALHPVPESETQIRVGKILVMDDEPVICKVAGAMIEMLGHEVDLASNGEEAIAKYRDAMQTGKPFDAAILDLTIRGGLGGSETVRRLASIDPGVKAVVSSGYADNAVIANYSDYGFISFLNKPYNLEGLRQLLHEILAGDNPG